MKLDKTFSRTLSEKNHHHTAIDEILNDRAQGGIINKVKDTRHTMLIDD